MSPRVLIADAVTLIALLAVVLLFTDRGAFAWVLAGVVFAAVVVSGLVMARRSPAT